MQSSVTSPFASPYDFGTPGPVTSSPFSIAAATLRFKSNNCLSKSFFAENPYASSAAALSA